MICWAWWYTHASAKGHHRCAEPEDHPGVHRCCCGAITERASHTAALLSKRQET